MYVGAILIQAALRHNARRGSPGKAGGTAFASLWYRALRDDFKSVRAADTMTEHKQ